MYARKRYSIIASYSVTTRFKNCHLLSATSQKTEASEIMSEAQLTKVKAEQENLQVELDCLSRGMQNSEACKRCVSLSFFV